ncbi:MAG TPA: Nif3-like dinuclear metal center hexameric protein, partial [Euzebyales bacterium]|nr:Nif3-like dinuclear metal center hexameric protein [Euzebyales bacterium]
RGCPVDGGVTVETCPGSLWPMGTDRLRQWMDVADACYAPEHAAAWDSVGLQVGDPDDPVTQVLVSLDVTGAVLDEAERSGADLILAHHPLLFRPLPRLTPGTAAGGLALRAARAGCAVLAVHTNFDAAASGTTTPIVDLLALRDVAPLEPLADDPALGLGRIGDLPVPLSLRDVADRLASGLPAPHLRVAGPLDRAVRRVAACAGAGDSLVEAAHRAGADLYVTGDLRHHVALDALQLGMTLIDAGHYATEAPALPALCARLATAAAARGLTAGLLASATITEPWSDYCAHHEVKART